MLNTDGLSMYVFGWLQAYFFCVKAGEKVRTYRMKIVVYLSYFFLGGSFPVARYCAKQQSWKVETSFYVHIAIPLLV